MVACVQASTAHTQAAATEAMAAQLGALVHHLLTTTGREVFQAIDDVGLSFTQIKTAQLLAEAEEPLSLGTISDELGLSQPAVSRAVDGLVKRGLCTRDEDPDDRRSKRLVITRRGRGFYERVHAIRVAGIRNFIEGLESAQRDALADALQSIAGREEIAARLPGGTRST
jgi:DNA-binding MarR family transcriptional regulator